MISLQSTMLIWSGKPPAVGQRTYLCEQRWQWRASVKEGVVCTTDGHRAHYERIAGLSDGSYDVTAEGLVTTSDSEAEAPFFEWRQAWEDTCSMEREHILIVRATAKPFELWEENPLGDRKGFTLGVPLTPEAPRVVFIERSKAEKKRHKTSNPHQLTLDNGKLEGVYLAHHYLREALNHAVPYRDSKATLYNHWCASPVIIGNPECSETFAIVMPIQVS